MISFRKKYYVLLVLIGWEKSVENCNMVVKLLYECILSFGNEVEIKLVWRYVFEGDWWLFEVFGVYLNFFWS